MAWQNFGLVGADNVDELCRIGLPVQCIIGGWSTGIHHLCKYLHQVRVFEPGRVGCVPGIGNSERFHETAQGLSVILNTSFVRNKFQLPTRGHDAVAGSTWNVVCSLLNSPYLLEGADHGGYSSLGK